MSTILPFGPGPGQWDTITELLQSAAMWDFANGQKMTIKGTVCGNVANANSIQGNGNYSNTGFVGGIQWVGPTGPIHSTYTSQPFACQWFTPGTFPPGCPSPPNEPSEQLFVDIATASNTAKNLAPTQTFAGIDTCPGDVTINVVSGLNVINIPPNPFGTTEGKLQVRCGNDLIISGPADAIVIFNVGADNQVNAVRNGMSVENGSSILTNGGVLPQNILFNVIGGDLTINGGTIDGNFIVRAGSDVKGKATIQGTTLINGRVLGDGNHSSEFLLDTNAKICPLQETPSIDVEKDVSPDNGITFFDADIPPGPNVVFPTNPQFKFTVTNNGATTLTNVTVTDDVFPGIIIGPITLAPGASATTTLVGAWAAGVNVNTATATGFSDGQQLTDTDPAFWNGVLASIDVEKEVSPDNGVTFFDADTAPGPNVVFPTNPVFRFTVTNNGPNTLNNVTVIDDVFPGTIIGPITLAPGQSQSAIVVGAWAPGQHVNIATATGDFEGQVFTDSDPAFWFGATAPSIDIEKLVSVDNGVTFVDADTTPGPLLPPGVTPQFKFVVSNNGGAVLTNIIVTDDVFGLIGTVDTMNPGDSVEFTIP